MRLVIRKHDSWDDSDLDMQLIAEDPRSWFWYPKDRGSWELIRGHGGWGVGGLDRSRDKILQYTRADRPT